MLEVHAFTQIQRLRPSWTDAKRFLYSAIRALLITLSDCGISSVHNPLPVSFPSFSPTSILNGRANIRHAPPLSLQTDQVQDGIPTQGPYSDLGTSGGDEGRAQPDRQSRCEKFCSGEEGWVGEFLIPLVRQISS